MAISEDEMKALIEGQGGLPDESQVANLDALRQSADVGLDPATPSDNPDGSQEDFQGSDRHTQMEEALSNQDNPDGDGQDPDDSGKELTPEEQIAKLQKELDDLKNKEKQEELEANPLEPVEKKAEEAGIDIDTMKSEFIKTGELTEAQLKELNDAGFTKEAIDAYIATKTNIEQKRAVTIMEQTVGSEEAYWKMAEWLEANKTDVELAEYNEGVNSQHAKAYIKSAYAEYLQATNQKQDEQKQTLFRGKGGNDAPITAGFKSNAEMVKAMQDPRYGNDVAYTTQVRDRVAKMR